MLLIIYLKTTLLRFTFRSVGDLKSFLYSSSYFWPYNFHRSIKMLEYDMSDRLKGKVIFVTGAGSIGPGWGNGKQLQYNCKRGGKVFITDKNSDALEETKK